MSTQWKMLQFASLCLNDCLIGKFVLLNLDKYSNIRWKITVSKCRKKVRDYWSARSPYVLWCSVMWSNMGFFATTFVLWLLDQFYCIYLSLFNSTNLLFTSPYPGKLLIRGYFMGIKNNWVHKSLIEFNMIYQIPVNNSQSPIT